MLAAPVFHDKYLIGNGEPCKRCAGTGRMLGKRGPTTSRRCKPCKGTGRAALPAEIVIKNTGAISRAARAARDETETAQVVVAQAEAKAERAQAAKVAPRPVCGLPLPIGFGRRPDDSMFITCGDPEVHAKSFSYPGTGPETLALVQYLNARPAIEAALRAVRSDCRDPDTDSAVSVAAGELVDEALAALGVRP